jgi:phospholipid/cholesterol/gamma-HCH transport system substrate-binding protein
VLDAISRRQGRLSTMVTAGNRLLDTTARRNAALTRAVEILPTTLRELRPTMDAVAATASDAAPVVRELRPGGRVFGQALRDTSVLAPRAQALFADVDRLAGVARDGLPAATKIVDSTRPVFQVLDPALRELVPVVQYLGLFKQDLVTSFANLSAAMQATAPSETGGRPVHYLRVVVPFTQEGFAFQSKRLASNRHNPYFTPEALRKLPEGLDAFDCANAGGRETEPAPLCKVQAPLEFQGRRLAYPHVEADHP